MPLAYSLRQERAGRLEKQGGKEGIGFPSEVRELTTLEYLSEIHRRIDWDQRQLLEFKISLVTLLQSGMLLYGVGWARGYELKGDGMLCILNVDSKVTQDDGMISQESEKSNVPDAACRKEKVLNSPSCQF